MAPVAVRSGPSLAELMGVLSLGIDLGLGLSMEHMLRSCTIGLGIAERAELAPADAELVYMTSLLAWVGCHADSHEMAYWFGNDIARRAAMHTIDRTPANQGRVIVGLVGSGRPPLARARRFAEFVVVGRKSMNGVRTRHCRLAGDLATRLGLRDDVRAALMHMFERWDGRGDPGSVGGEEIARPVRIVHLSDTIEVYHREGGPDAAVEMVRARRGTHFDPELADLFCAHAAEVLAPLANGTSWDAVMAQPSLSTPLPREGAVAALEAIADFVDLNSPYTLGHSRAVADLAAEAARIMQLPDDQVELVRRAGLLHDLGRLGISNGVWDKEEALSASEQERIRLQPYLTERMLSLSPTLNVVAPLASAHHERLDGSGYPRGLRGDALSPAAKILAAADVYQALSEPRPHRDARSAAESAAQLRAEVRAGKLDAMAADAVLQAAGHKVSRRPVQPAGLTAREIEVLKLLARGHKTKQIAEELVIAPKTVGHHIGHIYTKIGASNRVAASLFATEHGLLGPGDG
jgi:HD-GYP domain-containing protein (c-di-GMP phosphodiesterase class II)